LDNEISLNTAARPSSEKAQLLSVVRALKKAPTLPRSVMMGTTCRFALVTS
jgi:hypothetical protein